MMDRFRFIVADNIDQFIKQLNKLAPNEKVLGTHLESYNYKALIEYVISAEEQERINQDIADRNHAWIAKVKEAQNRI